MKQKPELHNKTWGYENWICNNEKYCSKLLHLEQHKWCSYHYHKIKDEYFYIIKGSILLEIGYTHQQHRKLITLKEGNGIRIEPYTIHRFIGLGEENIILETSTQHTEEDSYRMEPSYE